MTLAYNNTIAQNLISSENRKGEFIYLKQNSSAITTAVEEKL